MKTDSKDKIVPTRKIVGLFVFIAIILGLIITTFVIQQNENANIKEPEGSIENRFINDPPIVYKEQTYYKKKQVENYLFIGTDKAENTQDIVATDSATKYRNGAQSDFLMLLVVDHKEETIKRLLIDRDTMAEVTVLDTLGNEAGKMNLQICLAHAFGETKVENSIYAMRAVSRLLNSAFIEGYLTLNMTGINELNSLVGGVTVTLKDDFSSIDPTMVKGATINLQGEQAEIYVRSRMNVGDGKNATRMVRQTDYLTKLGDKILKNIENNPNFADTLLDDMEEDLYTDLSRGRLINEINRAEHYKVQPIQTLVGEHTTSDSGLVEFYPDKDALLETILGLFYTTKK